MAKRKNPDQNPIERLAAVEEVTRQLEELAKTTDGLQLTEDQKKGLAENKRYPATLTEIVGQEQLIKRIRIHIVAAKQKAKPLKHVLLYGPPGLGKTTIASLIAEDMESRIIFQSGRLLRSIKQIEDMVGEVTEGCTIFIDEIHGLQKKITDIFLTMMQDNRFGDIVLPPFTLIGASTSIGKLQKPMRDRFHHILEVRYYEPQHMVKIINEYAKREHYTALGKHVDLEISIRSHGIPRIAKRLLDVVKDYSDAKKGYESGFISKETALRAFKEVDIDDLGFEDTHRRIISYLFKQGRPIGKDTLSLTLSISPDDIEELFEGALLRAGMIMKTPKGRELTEDGVDYARKIASKSRSNGTKKK